MNFDYKRLIISLALPQLAGIVGSLFTASAIPIWYAGLVKPSLNPPSWVFGPTWIMLYFLMGIAAFLVWRELDSRFRGNDIQGGNDIRSKNDKKIKIALGIFGVQLFLNAVWSIIFFGLKNPGWAFVDIILLWFMIILTMVVFSKISRPAAWLLLPYILWVSFAGYLNYFIWYLN